MSRIRKTVIILLILTAAGCGGYSAYYFVHRAANEKIYTELQKQQNTIPAAAKAEEDGGQPDAKTPVRMPVDFAKLQKLNPDIYAWITIPDTHIDYPVAQSADDNNYYLNHTIEHKSGMPGSIFTENCNAKDFTDYNTVIYGHNMRNGTMFKDLHKYEDPDFRSQHEVITLYTPQQQLSAHVVAAGTYSDESILNRYDFSDHAQRLAFLKSLQQDGTLPAGSTAGPEQLADRRLVTLSTCEAADHDSRYIVVAVLE